MHFSYDIFRKILKANVLVVDVAILINAIEVNMDDEMRIDKSILKEIVDFIQKINYGEVVITVHDSNIVQIEKREKKRFKKR